MARSVVRPPLYSYAPLPVPTYGRKDITHLDDAQAPSGTPHSRDASMSQGEEVRSHPTISRNKEVRSYFVGAGPLSLWMLTNLFPYDMKKVRVCPSLTMKRSLLVQKEMRRPSLSRRVPCRRGGGCRDSSRALRTCVTS